jgi:hypothetical protein
MQIITKAEARARGLKFFYTGPCRNGHDAERYVSAGACVECLKEWKPRNPDKVKAADAKWEATRRSEYDRVYRTLNREKVIEGKGVSPRRAHVRAELGAHRLLKRFLESGRLVPTVVIFQRASRRR